jgi:predicted metal-dependent phosphotriesterase family hydrolase
LELWVKVHTVLGEIDPADLGRTMMHEHTLVDMELSPGDYDAIVSDERMLVAELQAYREAGGSAIVDVTPSHLGRNPLGLARISSASGVHIVMGGGWYRHEFHPDEVATTSTNALADKLIREFTEGVDGTGIKPGLLGELGTGRGPVMSLGEERAFRAVGRAQREIGFCISTHTTHYGELAHEQIGVLREEGVPDDRIIIGHLGEYVGADDVIAIAETGVCVQIDHVGRPSSAGMISDDQRAKNVAQVIAAGHVRQLTASMDICSNSAMHEHGGHGYDHLLRTFVPLLRAEGVSDSDIHQILVENPRARLAF